MRVLLVQETYLPLVGGAEWHLHHLARNLVALGNQVEIVTGRSGDAHLAGHQDPCPVQRHPGAVGRRGLPYLPLWLVRFVRLFRRFDLVHVHHPSLLCFAAVLAARVTGTPVVLTLHGLGVLDSSVSHSWLKRLYRRVSFRGVTRVIATSEEMREVARRFVPDERIVLITNGVDTSRFAPRQPRTFTGVTDQLRLVTVRRFTPKNGVQYAVEALIRAGDRVRGHLRLIGDGVLRPRIEAAVQAAGAQERIRLEGFFGPEALIEALEQADAALFLSTAESTSLAVLECLAMGCLVVASNAGALPDLVQDGETGFILPLFAPGSSDYRALEHLTGPQEELVIAALERLQAHPPERLAAIAAAARRFVVDNFDWHPLVARTVAEVYQPALGSRGTDRATG